MILPKKITPQSKINLIHTSSPIGKADFNYFVSSIMRLSKKFPNTEIFDVERTELDPRYLAASERERLKKFRQAINNVDWLAPIFGGTGCEDIVRYFDDHDLAEIRKNRPIINGFSDTTFLINYVFFKLKLITFHYSNASGIFLSDNYRLFFDVIQGNIQSFSFLENNYDWLTSNEPQSPIEGIAIGGNFSTFRDLLDVVDLKVTSWRPYILFIEEIGTDVEDLHRLIIALDAKGIFRNIRALVIGRMNEKEISSNLRRFNVIFGQPTGEIEHVVEYLLSNIIKERLKKNDPLHILKVDNLGHGVRKNTMLIPIGAKTVIYPDKKIEFQGPFVE